MSDHDNSAFAHQGYWPGNSQNRGCQRPRGHVIISTETLIQYQREVMTLHCIVCTIFARNLYVHKKFRMYIHKKSNKKPEMTIAIYSGKWMSVSLRGQVVSTLFWIEKYTHTRAIKNNNYTKRYFVYLYLELKGKSISLRKCNTTQEIPRVFREENH